MEAGVTVYILGGPLPVTELHVRCVVIWTWRRRLMSGKKRCNMDILIEARPRIEVGPRMEAGGPTRLY